MFWRNYPIMLYFFVLNDNNSYIQLISCNSRRIMPNIWRYFISPKKTIPQKVAWKVLCLGKLEGCLGYGVCSIAVLLATYRRSLY